MKIERERLSAMMTHLQMDQDKSQTSSTASAGNAPVQSNSNNGLPASLNAFGTRNENHSPQTTPSAPVSIYST